MLKRNHIVLPLKSLNDPDNSQIHQFQKELTIKNHNEFEKDRQFFKIINASQIILIPRYFGLRRLKKSLVRDDIEDGQQIHLQFQGTLRDHVPQQKAVDATLRRFYRTDFQCGGYLKLPTGFGKTTCALKIISELGRKTLILVHNTLLLDQWKARIGEFLPAASMLLIQGQKYKYEDAHIDIVIAMVQTLSRRKEKDALVHLSNVGLLIVDECHHVPTESLQDALLNLPRTPRYTLGLTATPDRRDNCGKAIEWILGPLIFSYDGSSSGTKTKVCRLDFRSDVEVSYFGASDQKINLSKLNSDLAKNKARNDFIVDKILQVLPTGRKILVLTDRVFHVKILLAYLQNSKAQLESSWGREFTFGACMSTNKQVALQSMHTWDIIVSTFQLFREGIDVPTLDTLVLANPVTNIEQSVGRIQRYAAKKKYPLVMDIVDNNIDVLTRFYFKRNRFYRTKNIEHIPAIFINTSIESESK